MGPAAAHTMPVRGEHVPAALGTGDLSSRALELDLVFGAELETLHTSDHLPIELVCSKRLAMNKV